MKAQRWLICTKAGIDKIVVNDPRPLPFGKVPILLTVEIPDSLFIRPTINAKLIVPDEVPTPPVVTAETLATVQDAFDGAGLRVELSIGEPQ